MTKIARSHTQARESKGEIPNHVSRPVEMHLVGEHFGLVRQVGAAAVNCDGTEIETRDDH